MKVIVTGGCGFIGHHLVEHLYLRTDWQIVVIDKLSYASKGFSRLRDSGVLDSPRIEVFCFDLSQSVTPGLQREIGTDVEMVIHLAAETHVDNSIADPVGVIGNNVMSTVHLLEYARKLPKLRRLVYFSTDEVYGPALGDHLFREGDRYRSTNPYSASKAASEQICVAYQNTYGIPLITVNAMNVFGERQHVEKFIPKTVRYVLEGRTLPIHCYPDCEESGTRFYIHARNLSDAVLFVAERGELGETYHITGEKEVSNLAMAQFIAKAMGRELKYEMVDFHSSRPGHDLRYGLDGAKLFALGWRPPLNFEESLTKTIQWTVENPQWLED
jgi:dTDP-glucose 4,6-dehydratase